MSIKFKMRESNMIIYLIIALSPLIDIIYTVNTKFLEIDFPIHQAIRVLIIAYLFMNLKRKKSKKMIVCLLLLLLLGQFFIIFNGYDYNIMSNFSYILKIINLFCITEYVKEKLDLNFITIEEIIKSLKIASIILSTNIILSNIFKIGLKTYDYGNRGGYKGFIEAHNDVTIVLLMILPIVIYDFFKNKRKSDVALIIIISISLLIIGPKAGKVLLILEMAVIIVKYLNQFKINRFTRKILLFISVVGTLFLFTNISSIYSKMEGYANSRGYKSIYSYVVSYRDIQPRLIDNAIGDQFKIHPKYLFGMGYFYANKELNLEKNEFNSIENDFEGLIYYSGILTASIIIFLILEKILKIFSNKKINSQLKFFVVISLFIGLLHAFLGGHVIYSAISNTYFSVLLAIGCHKEKIVVNRIEEYNE